MSGLSIGIMDSELVGFQFTVISRRFSGGRLIYVADACSAVIWNKTGGNNYSQVRSDYPFLLKMGE